MIAVLAVMIAAAGYLNYSGRIFDQKGEVQETGNELAGQELLDISQEDLENVSGEIDSPEKEPEGEVEGTPGEAVLTAGEAGAVVAEAKVTREQVRAKNKETLLEIVENKELSDEQKQSALNQLTVMTELAEKEAAAETLLASKGFPDSVVSLTEESADVVIEAAELSDASLAQIEDIVTRKTGVAAENIVITPVHAQKK